MAHGMRACVKGLMGYDMASYESIIELKPKDNRSGEEIAVDVARNAGLVLVK